jgi:hypothetical protein
MKRLIYCQGLGMVILLLLASAANASDEAVPLDNIPKPVMEAIHKRFMDMEVNSAVEEKEDNQLVYELALKVAGQNTDVVLTPEGEFLVIEKTIDANSMPSAVSKTLEGKYPKAVYERLEEVIKVVHNVDQPAYYEALLVTAKKNRLEVELTAEGKIIEEKKATD